MQVCIVRNSELENNPGLLRVLDAMITGNYIPVVLSRSRHKSKGSIVKPKIHRKNNQEVVNNSIEIPAERGKGLSNMFNLICYQFIVFLWLIINNNKMDIIHAFDLDAGLPAYFVSKMFKKKYVYHIADYYVDSRKGIPERLKNRVRDLENYLINKSDLTIICTEERKQQISGSKPQKLKVIHNTPIVEEDITINEDIDDITIKKELQLNYIGALHSTRFVTETLEVVSEIADLNLRIGGFGTEQEIVESYGERFGNIEFIGEIDYQNALLEYATCDLVMAIYDPKVPNHKFSAPNKIYEAMMLGKPIIVAKNTGIDKIVEEENMGYVIEYNKNEFKNLIYKLLEDRGDMHIKAMNARIAYKKYSWETMRNSLLEAYSEL